MCSPLASSLPEDVRTRLQKVFVVSIDPTAQWDHSKFPHPLLTVDYDAAGNVIQVVAVGTQARRMAEETAASLRGLVPDRDTVEDDEAVQDPEAPVLSKSPVPQEAFERFPGRWIALRNGKLIADASTNEELRQDNRVESTDALFRVPEPSTHFYGTRLG